MAAEVALVFVFAVRLESKLEMAMEVASCWYAAGRDFEGQTVPPRRGRALWRLLLIVGCYDIAGKRQH
jgi:hypothetical protein